MIPFFGNGLKVVNFHSTLLSLTYLRRIIEETAVMAFIARVAVGGVGSCKNEMRAPVF